MYNKHTLCKTVLVVLHLVLHALAISTPVEFDPSQSSSFSNYLFYTYPEFTSEYQDGSNISGYVCEDQVTLGNATLKVQFGCATAALSDGPWVHNGIIGLGLADPNSPALGKPLLYSLCDSGQINPCIFSILLTNEGGEIHLGGFIKESVNLSTLLYTPVVLPRTWESTSSHNYIVYTEGLRIAMHEDDLSTGYSRDYEDLQIETLVDSGVSCTLLPTAGTYSGRNINIYKMVYDLVDRNSTSTLFVKIAGVQYEIPLTDCFSANPHPARLTLGDPFFRGHVVIHDLTDRNAPRLGFAQKNPMYSVNNNDLVIYTDGNSSVDSPRFASDPSLTPKTRENNVLPLWKKTNKAISTRALQPNMHHEIDVTWAQTSDRNMYFTILGVGTPQQYPFLVQIDTGSCLTAIFSKDTPNPPTWQVALFSLGVIIVGSSLFVGCLLYIKRLSCDVDKNIAELQELSEEDDDALESGNAFQK